MFIVWYSLYRRNEKDIFSNAGSGDHCTYDRRNTQMTTETNSNVDPRNVHFALMAKGLQETGAGQSQMDDGRAHLIAGAVMAYRESDSVMRETMLRHASGIHADPKEQKGAYADAWAYWRNTLDTVRADAKVKTREEINTDLHRAPAKAKDDTMGSEERQSLNRLINSRIAAIKYACLVLVAFDEAKIDWDGVKLGARSVSIKTTVSNARVLFGAKKKASIDGLDLEESEFLSIKGNTGAFRFSTLAQNGEDILKARGVKQVKPRATADASALRDTLRNAVSGLDNAERKLYDAKVGENDVLKVFVQAANALNLSTLTGFRFDNTDYSAIDWITEGATAVAEGKPMPPQYAALRQFVANMLDKNISSDKKAA